MRSRITQQVIAFGATVVIPWGLIALLVATVWPENLGVAVINGLGFISVVGVATVNRRHYDDRANTIHVDVDTLRTAVDTAIAASDFGKILAKFGGVPYRPAFPDGPVQPVCVPDAAAVAGMEDGTVVDLDAVRDAIRHSHN